MKKTIFPPFEKLCSRHLKNYFPAIKKTIFPSFEKKLFSRHLKNYIPAIWRTILPAIWKTIFLPFEKPFSRHLKNCFPAIWKTYFCRRGKIMFCIISLLLLGNSITLPIWSSFIGYWISFNLNISSIMKFFPPQYLINYEQLSIEGTLQKKRPF